MKAVMCAAAAVMLAGCSKQPTTYEEALNAYSHNRVAEAEAALRKLAAGATAKPDEKARAYRELARISWLIDGNAAGAQALLRSAEATGEGGCDTALLLARVLQESDGDAELLARAPGLASRCTDADEAAQLRLRAAAAALDLAAAAGDMDEAARAQAKTHITALTDDVRGGLEASAVRLEIALLESDAAGALRAWKDYFWLTETDLPQGLAKAYPAATPIFEAALAAGADPLARLRLVDLLMRAGFANAAERFAHANDLPGQAGSHPLWRKAAAYFDARRELQETVVRSNRVVVRGGKAADLQAAAEKMRGRLLAAAGAQPGQAAALRELYGLHGQTGETEGYASVHYGHVVQDERRTIEQYGHRANVAFLALDNLISNGFSSWLWDGNAEVGGWAEPDQTIVQVRTGFTSSPLAGWSLFRGGAARDELTGREKERAAADLTVLQGREVAYLPGLANRLRVQIADQIGARARLLAGGGDLRRAFLQEYWQATFRQSILTHEGRHALDRKLVRGLTRLNDSNLEYRAKLSELALAEYPRLALLNINDSSIGSGTGHGKANERLLRGYTAWIAEHASEVRGFDPKLPPLVQLDRLSDDQLRAVARSLDPIAPKAAVSGPRR